MNTPFEHCKNNDATVRLLTELGQSPENIVAALVVEKNRLLNRLMELEAIAPMKIITPDGKCHVWRAPEELLPDHRSFYIKDFQPNQ